jgi:UDP-glucose 4-epimerase
VEIVFHEAALASVPRSVADPVATNEACVDATLNLLVAARAAGVRRVIYAGSSSATATAPTLPKHEGMLPNPISPYAVAKLAGEHYMRAFTRVYGLETVVLRYFNVFGPYQDPTSHYSGVLAIFCRACWPESSQPSTATASRAAILHISITWSTPISWPPRRRRRRFPARMMNLAPVRKRITLNRDLCDPARADRLQRQAGYAPQRAGDIRDSLADIRLAGELLGYEPRSISGRGCAAPWSGTGRAEE